MALYSARPPGQLSRTSQVLTDGQTEAEREDVRHWGSSRDAQGVGPGPARCCRVQAQATPPVRATVNTSPEAGQAQSTRKELGCWEGPRPHVEERLSSTSSSLTLTVPQNTTRRHPQSHGAISHSHFSVSQLQRAAFLHPSLRGPREGEVWITGRRWAQTRRPGPSEAGSGESRDRDLRRSAAVREPQGSGEAGARGTKVRGADATPRPPLLGLQGAPCAPRTRALSRAVWRRSPGLARAGADRPRPPSG